LISSRPTEADVRPLPKELTTPPVMKMYFAMLEFPAKALRGVPRGRG
jgi:hypothetical protein